jgi:hypothetical protein
MQLRLLLLIELLWWVITGVVIFAVLWPIWNAGIEWPFQAWNIVFIISLITFARHIFLLQYSLLFKQQLLKLALIITMILLAFICIAQMNAFMVYIEEHTWDSLTGALPLPKKIALESYMWNEMLFFSVGTLISIPLLAIRLFMSVWKQYNKKSDKLWADGKQ